MTGGGGGVGDGGGGGGADDDVLGIRMELEWEMFLFIELNRIAHI